MDGACRSFGSPIPFTALGHTALLYPLTLSDWGTLEYLLLSRRLNPADALSRLAESCASSLAPDTVVKLHVLFKEARASVRRDRASRCVRLEELREWLDTPEGEDYSAWICLGKGRRSCRSPERAAVFLDRGGADLRREFRRLRDMVSGTDLMAAMDWPATKDDEGDKEQFFPWKRVLRYFAERFAFGPDDVGKLTLYNVMIYTSAPERLGGVVKMDMADALDFIQRRQMMQAAEE